LNYISSIELDALPKLAKWNFQTRGSRVAICIKKFGIWQRYTWKEYYEMVKYLSLGLISLGLQSDDVVCIIGDNKPEWVWGELATQAAGGMATGVFVDSIPSEVSYIAFHSNARFAIVNDQEQADKFLEIRDKLPSLERIIYWNPKGLKDYDDPLLISFAEVVEIGKDQEKKFPGIFEQAIDKLNGEKPAFIYYTAGTTGLPKGAVLSHRALINTGKAFLSRYQIGESDDLLSNFPAAWVGDGFFATVPHLMTGAVLNFPEEPETISTDIREVGPSLMANGPRQWESIVNNIREKMSYVGRLKRMAWRTFLPIGYEMADMRFLGKKPGFWLRLRHAVAQCALLRPLRNRLGWSRVKFAITGGSVLSQDIFRMVHAIGIELRQNYATTEAGFVSCHRGGEIKPETVGRPVVGAELRISQRGELLVRSQNIFNGYYKDRAKTDQVLVNGWCRTGDAANIGEDGHLIFMDHLEHMGELRAGVKYSPQYIEGRLRFSKYIRNAVVIGGKNRDFVSALINIDVASVRKWAEHYRLPCTSILDLCQRKEVAELVAKDLTLVNGYLPEAAGVKRFVLLHKEFDADEAEFTRTRKPRRALIEDKYRELIKAIYISKNEVEIGDSKTPYADTGAKLTNKIKIWTVG